jgi:hypothetical protein
MFFKRRDLTTARDVRALVLVTNIDNLWHDPPRGHLLTLACRKPELGLDVAACNCLKGKRDQWKAKISGIPENASIVVMPSK